MQVFFCSFCNAVFDLPGCSFPPSLVSRPLLGKFQKWRKESSSTVQRELQKTCFPPHLWHFSIFALFFLHVWQCRPSPRACTQSAKFLRTCAERLAACLRLLPPEEEMVSFFCSRCGLSTLSAAVPSPVPAPPAHAR